jgi:hypothetical protein
MKKNRDIILKNVRLSFNDLFEPQQKRSMPNGDEIGGKFRATVLVPKDDPEGNMKIIEKAIKDAIAARWPSNPPKIRKDKLPYSDGDDSDREEFQEHWVVRATEKPEYPPLIVDRDTSLLRATDGKPYSGCYVNLRVAPYAWDASVAKGVSFSLKAVQFVRDGERFGAPPLTPEDAFEPLEDDDDVDADDLIG